MWSLLVSLLYIEKSQLYRMSQGFCMTYRVTLRKKPSMDDFKNGIFGVLRPPWSKPSWFFACTIFFYFKPGLGPLCIAITSSLSISPNFFPSTGAHKISIWASALLLSLEENWTAWCVCCKNQSWKKEIFSQSWCHVSFWWI